ncbi:immunity 49 family protein [Streptomyces sp900116325]|uniref:immunity 49 family protein n=1 Tax=Streptomyces sp. 900116325 TaxID=3154295 RepID=UPI0034046D63
MAAVRRPEYPTEKSAEALRVLEKSAQRAIDWLETSAEDIDSALGLELKVAKLRCVLDPRAEEIGTWAAFFVAKEVGAALFASASVSEGEEVNVQIAGKDMTLAATGPKSYADASTWVETFWLAVICRDRHVITQLCNVPVSFLRECEPHQDEYIYAWVESLQTYWLSGPGLGDKLVAAVDACDPASVRMTPRDAALKLFYPPMNLFYRFVVEEHAEFNSALTEALDWFRDYWTDEVDESRMMSVNGVIPLEVLGVACLAYDAQFPVEVESNYLPENLLKGAVPSMRA